MNFQEKTVKKKCVYVCFRLFPYKIKIWSIVNGGKKKIITWKKIILFISFSNIKKDKFALK